MDILAAEDILGPDVGLLKGKTTKSTPGKVDMVTASIPVEIMSRYKDVTLAADIMKLKSIPFLVSISRSIKFGTTDMLQCQKASAILAAVKKIRGVYMRRGFNITTVLMGGQFEPLHGELVTLGMNLNTVSRGEHDPEIE